MDQRITAYLFTLAGLSIAFVGFSTIAIAFLQATERKMSILHFALVRLFFVNGLAAAGFSLLPPLLDLLGLPDVVIWRLSSALLVACLVTFFIAGFRLRRQAVEGPPPLGILINITVSLVVIVLLCLNVAGVFFTPNVGAYAVGATWLLTVSGLTFAQNMGIFLQRPEESDKS
jgi:hypothetical protein